MTRSFRLLMLPLLVAAAAAGCSSMRPPERFPELVKPDAPVESLGTLREAEHCYIASVDDNYITQYDINALAPATYRQLLVPPGKHTLAIFYREQRNLETITAGPRYVIVETQAGKTYELRSGLNGAIAPFADTLDTANWRPAVIDTATGERTAVAKINDR